MTNEITETGQTSKVERTSFINPFTGAEHQKRGHIMKYKTTIKKLKDGYGKIVSIGYCDLKELLKCENAVAYNSGIYGWNFDVYDIDGVAIVTGYRRMPSKNSVASYTLINEYETKSLGKTREEKRALLREFIGKTNTKSKE